MGAIDERELAGHIDRVRRRIVACRGGVVVRGVPGGWMSVSVEPGAGGAFPSSNSNRVYWMAPGRELTGQDVASGVEAMRAAGQTRMCLWFAPSAINAEVEERLRGLGANVWPHVEYPALARASGPCEPDRATEFSVRLIGAAETAAVLAGAQPWYGADGEAAGLRLVERGISEFHAAFEGDRPVAIGMLSMDGEWAYLGAAATAPERRGRGGQTAIICSRVRRAAELGARWCACETNTAAPTSLNNLKRCGFEEAIRWRVYGLDGVGA